SPTASRPGSSDMQTAPDTLPSATAVGAAMPAHTGHRRRRGAGGTALVVLALALSVLFLGVPLAAIFAEAFRAGAAAYAAAILQPDTLHAIWLTVLTAIVVVPINIVFGIAAAWAV